MKDLTGQLKNYWKSKDLTFIATFRKMDENHGFFLNFIHPLTKKEIYYPDFTGAKFSDKQVSFICFELDKFKDGDYYKVELVARKRSKLTQTPYSLVIKKISVLNQDKIEHLLTSVPKNKYEGLKFYGSYKKENERFACFENVMHEETGEILIDQGESLKVYVSPSIKLSKRKYYSFSIVDEQEKLPKAINDSINILNADPYQEYIRLRFERLNNPEANKMIANLMREIGKGMYSSKQRMIFELLQNADDAPGKERVEFHIDINGDYFFVMHDGAPFNKDDVEAITSAAESTKRGDSKKTGYKGIGFKSVFTDSTEVWLKSGGYQFAFLRNSELFEDFDKFYFSSERYKKYPELLAEDKLKYRKQRLRFNGSTDIPWQVIPIWQKSLPNEFTDSNFNNFNNPVQFALKLGEKNIEDYKTAIDNIAKRPQFLLFLRNTSKFRSPKNGITVLRNDKNQIIEIIKSKKTGPNKVYHYIKQTFENIEISDEAFEQLDIGLKKQSKINDYNEVTFYFTDLEGREIETIPPKLASAFETEISFGISLVNNKISPEKEYIKGLSKYSSLFTYLPMEDTRFQLPFLVNADFVPSSDRQRIQGDNLWNKYIMIKVAEKHVATLAHFAREFLNDNDTNISYLSLLLKNPLPEDDTAQQIIESYNAKYLEQLEKTEIVINDNDQIQLLSDTIIDDSGLIELFGNEIFYDIIDTEKRLPNAHLDAKYLKDYDYLEVDVIDLEELAEQITPELCESFGSIIDQRALFENPDLFKWLNRLVKYIPHYFGKIPFIVHNNALFSLEQLIDEDDAWLINEHTSQYSDLIGELGYHTIQLHLEKYSNIKEFLHSFNAYINDKTLAYERIASNVNIHKLSVTSKLKLLDFFQNSAFMVGISVDKYFGKLKLFLDESDNPRPIWQLLSRKDDLEVNSIDKFRVKETEFNSLSEDLQKQLIAKDEIFTSFILNKDLFEEWSHQFETKNIDGYVTDLKNVYSWIDNPEEISNAQWASIPWLYIDDEVRFETSDKVYWSKAFEDLSADKFEIIKSVFHKAKLKTLPVQKCGSLINMFPIKTDSSSDINWSEVEELEMIVANTLLDWMEDDGFRDFFKNYTLVANTNSSYTIEEVEDVHIFDVSNKDLTAYIQSNTEISALFVELDGNLCSENRSLIGLLQGDKLLKAMIDSGGYDQNLALHLPSNVSPELLHSFISNLKEFKLFTSSDYRGETPEHIIIHNILNKIDESEVVSEEISKVIKILKAKTLINEQPLKDFDISNAISFGKGKIIKELHLSDVLNKYDGETNVLEEILESFTQITNKRKLRKHIFKTRILEPQEIHYEIEKENSTFYSIEQVVFQLLDKSFRNNRNWSKSRFDDHYLKNGTEEQLHKSYQAFLDILFDLEFIELGDFTFHGLTLKNCVDKNYAIQSEYIPDWLEEWVNKDQAKRLEFLSTLGYNGIDSAIVKLRKASIADNYDSNKVIRFFDEAKLNQKVIWNTIKWLAKSNKEIITRNIDLIKEINNHIILDNDENYLTIPIIDSINPNEKRSYRLQQISTGVKLYRLRKDEKFAYDIFNVLKVENEQILFIDESSGKKAGHFFVENFEIDEEIDSELLESNSKLWDEQFYRKWEHSNDYPIHIYDGDDIPYTRSFSNITINTFTQDLKVTNDGRFYVSKRVKNDILNNLPESFPEKMLSNLMKWYYKTSENESLLDEDSFDYKEDIDRLLQDRLGISEKDQKRESGNAKTHALYFLDENGYDVSNVNKAGAALTDIIDPDGNQVKCIVRSAKGGLLYLDKEHWDMMQDDFMYLIVIYPGNSPRLFKNRLELLEEELAENVLFRVPNNKFTSEIDDVFNALESESHLILVTGEKMKESLFSKLKQKNEINKEENAAVGSEDFRP